MTLTCLAHTFKINKKNVFFRKLLGNFYFYSVGLMPGILSSLCAILIERKNRRGALAVYMFNQVCVVDF